MDENGVAPDRYGNKVKPILTSDSVEYDASQYTKSPAPVTGRMVLRPWRTRFWDQFTALTRKQGLVYMRNIRATVLRLLAPLFFMFLLWLLNLAFRADNVALDAFIDYPDPASIPVGAIPSCDQDLYMRTECWDFIYSPNTSEAANSIAAAMRANNPGRPIPESSVLGFASIADANTFLEENPESTLGGIHFLDGANGSPSSPDGLDFVLQVNFTTKFFKGRFQDPTFFAAVPLQAAVEREIASYQWAQAGRTDPLQWNVSYSQFAHPETGSINIVGQAMGPFVFAANMFNFVLLLASLVSERERGLRQALTTSGMLDSAFWISWLAVELVISVIFTLFIIAFGAMFQFNYFLHNSIGLVFLLFLLFQWAMIGIAFILSAFIAKTSTAINLGFVIFLVGWVLQAAIAFDFPFTPDYIGSVPVLTAIFILIPAAPLAKGAVDLGLAGDRSADGISWSRRSSYCQNLDDPSAADSLYASNPTAYWDFSCVFPLGTIITVLALEFVVYALIGVYLDNVLANESGVRKKPWYLFSPSYWCGRRADREMRSLQPPVVCPVEVVEVDPDVAAEEAAMRDLLQHRDGTGRTDALASTAAEAGTASASASAGSAHAAIEVFGLQKAFGRPWCKGCCSCSCFTCGAKNSKVASSSGSPPRPSKEFWAIKGSWFSMQRGQLFCLLGPNGAGKTTTINCLTGVLPPTGGDALVYGESITAPGGLDRIRSVMGVCPQFDVQWGELTGAEHLRLYGRIKGLRGPEVKAQAEELLESVKLTAAAGQRTGQYSGGMRRRLSVAIALLGDPLVVYLDEPTTGMDPISRRHVWDAIESAKAGRAIVLTTHSMEEADILGDTIAIMARGRLRAHGSSLRLKQRFGSGYQLSVAVNNKGAKGEAARETVISMFVDELGVPAPEESKGQYLVFQVPKSKESQLPGFLKRLEDRGSELGISDVQISLTSLEEVFLSIAKKAELEAAAAEGRSEVSVTLEDGSVLEVPMGDEFATQETTGRTYVIKWAQDEEGKLQVMSWSLADGSGRGSASFNNGNGNGSRNGAAPAAAAAVVSGPPGVQNGMSRTAI